MVSGAKDSGPSAQPARGTAQLEAHLSASILLIGTRPTPWRPILEVSEDGSDLIVATGTGSGKDGDVSVFGPGRARHGSDAQAASFAKNAVRALLLYPMNALVSDQTARLRRLFGDETPLRAVC